MVSEARAREAILVSLAQNSETNLKDEDAALTRYLAVVEGNSFLGTSDQYSALNGVARLLAKRGRFEEALAALQRVDLEKLQGFWLSQFQLWNADTLATAARPAEARAMYQRLLADTNAEERFKKLAAEKISKLPQ